MTAEARFERASSRLLAEDAALEQGRMLRSVGLKAGGRFFAFARGGELVVKLRADRVRDLVASGAGRPFESGRRTMKEWVALSPADDADLLAYVREARASLQPQPREVAP